MPENKRYLLTFIQSGAFSKKWDELGFDDDDLRLLELMIMDDPEGYPVVQGTGGLRKLRFAAKGKGKRSGSRICYVNFLAHETVILVSVYMKNEKTDLSQKEKKAIKKTITMIEKYL